MLFQQRSVSVSNVESAETSAYSHACSQDVSTKPKQFQATSRVSRVYRKRQPDTLRVANADCVLKRYLQASRHTHRRRHLCRHHSQAMQREQEIFSNTLILKLTIPHILQKKKARLSYSEQATWQKLDTKQKQAHYSRRSAQTVSPDATRTVG
jgi:hypothetical protein